MKRRIPALFVIVAAAEVKKVGRFLGSFKKNAYLRSIKTLKTKIV
jgi:hypothetical protein